MYPSAASALNDESSSSSSSSSSSIQQPRQHGPVRYRGPNTAKLYDQYYMVHEYHDHVMEAMSASASIVSTSSVGEPDIYHVEAPIGVASCRKGKVGLNNSNESSDEKTR